MIRGKKISCDFLHLALLLAVIRLGPETLWGSYWYEPLEVGDILGPTLAYRHFYGHSLNSRAEHYVNLKRLDSVVLDEVSTSQNLPYFINDKLASRSNIIAYYSDNPNIHSSEEQQHSEEHRHTSINTTRDITEEDRVNGAQAEVSVLQLENSSLELSAEDMDLIEILWKQDIDLGVSREAFNVHENAVLEKGKVEPNIEIKADHVKESKSDIVYKLEKENASMSSNAASSNFVIDSETGEYVKREPKLEAAKSSLPFEESMLSFEGFDEFTNIFEENCTNEVFSNKLLFEGDQLSQILDEFDPEILDSQLEKMDNDTTPASTDMNDFDLAGEMYPSMEEYWQDISTTLPLSVMNQTCVLPRPSRPFAEGLDDHSGTSAYSDQPRPSPSDHSFTDAFSHSATMAARSLEMNSSFTYMSPLLGPTSLGCAVASSIATLTNDTDPMPDVSVPLNATFGFDMPNVMPINQTTPQATNETMLSELLLDEELQLMDVASASASPYHPQGNQRSVPFMRIFDQEPNSSDTVSSLEYDENEQTNFEELPSSCAGKEVIYGAFKYQSDQTPLNCALHPVDSSPNNPSYGMGLHTPFRGNYSCFQHNHTYHMPFSNGNNIPKPLTRDKLRQLSCDNESNSRDEKRAKALELPISISDIINLAIDEFNEKLTKFELTEPQMTLIRDIRRRGKNKVAAQNCRKRKMDQINHLQQDLCVLHDERLHLESERNRLLHQRRNIRDKYTKLCQLVVQSSSSPVPINHDFSPDQSSSSSVNNNLTSANADLAESDSDMMCNQGVRSKKKVVKKS